MKRIHFIAIGGSAMHNLAISLKQQGFLVSGSDDEIFEPSKSRLENLGLLPAQFGWFPENITQDLDMIVLGMHARVDNPELLKAQELGIRVVSYPEFLYHATENKMRIVIAGSHGKTTTTAMIMHVLKSKNIIFDYMVGSHIEGFDNMTGLFKQSKVAVFEGDEYLSSPIDRRSKFLWYKPHIVVITGIEWDHINVFPTFVSYMDTFKQLVETMPKNGKIIWYRNDKNIASIIQSCQTKTSNIQYVGFDWEQDKGNTYVHYNSQRYPMTLFGDHNFQNLNAAFLVCKEAFGFSDTDFFNAVATFKGANRRLQIVKEATNPVYYDFAHAPSKVRATVAAVRQLYPDKKITACLELHTFSSLNKNFIPYYKDTLNFADRAFVYFNPNVLKHKGMPLLEDNYIISNFNQKSLAVCTNNMEMFNILRKDWENGAILLLMSSGNFGGVDPIKWADELK